MYDTDLDEVTISRATTKLIPLRGILQFISNSANDPVTLYAHDVATNGIQAHLAKPAAIIQEKNKWSGGTVRFRRSDNQVENISTSVACAHSLYIREVVNKTGVHSLILNCTKLPFHWHTIKAVIQFIRTGSLQLDSTALEDMIQCAMFFRIAQLSRLVEAFLIQRSMEAETVLNAYKAIFHDEQVMRCVTYDTQRIVSENMANYILPYIQETIKNERSTLAQMTNTELYWLLTRDSQRIRHNQREYEDAACQRFHVVIRWIQFHAQTYEFHDQSAFSAKATQLFGCVHFEHMRPETRRHVANYLRGLPNEIFMNTAQPYLSDVQ